MEQVVLQGWPLPVSIAAKPQLRSPLFGAVKLIEFLDGLVSLCP